MKTTLKQSQWCLDYPCKSLIDAGSLVSWYTIIKLLKFNVHPQTGRIEQDVSSKPPMGQVSPCTIPGQSSFPQKKHRHTAFQRQSMSVLADGLHHQIVEIGHGAVR